MDIKEKIRLTNKNAKYMALLGIQTDEELKNLTIILNEIVIGLNL